MATCPYCEAGNKPNNDGWHVLEVIQGYSAHEVWCQAPLDIPPRMSAAASKLFDALREMSEWWAYAMEKPVGAKPSADDHKKVEQLAVKALDALHAADPDYVHRLPGAAH